MRTIKLLSGIGFLASIAWFITAPDYEPAISALGSLAALIALFMREKKAASQPVQSQSLAENSIGIQAGGDIQVGSIHSERK
jgi:hypothetical protein